MNKTTKSAQFTLGPWVVNTFIVNGQHKLEVLDATGANACVQANAHLIAAAPEMYGDIATLVEVEGTITIHDGIACLPDGTTINLQATKAKAEGR